MAKMLRGVAPLTMYRGAGGPGGHLYRNSVIDPRLVDEVDRTRLLGEGFVEWVEPDGESWKRAQDTAEGSKGDSVTVGDVSVVPPTEVDNGTVNTAVDAVAEPDADDVKRADARAKLAEMGGTPDGRSSEAVWIEFAVSKGIDRAEAEKAGKDELRRLLTDK